jgi:hypothetical protein
LDIGETKNLISEEQDKVREMANILSNHLIKVKAQMPMDKATGEQVEFPVSLL